MELLTEEEIARRLNELDTGSPSAGEARKFVRPLRAVGESLIESLRVEDGIGLGLSQLDVLTRGFRPTDLILITGFAASAKTQLVNTMLLNNPEKRVLFFSLDDPAELILAKLVAMSTGQSSEQLERKVREGDAAAIQSVLSTAVEAFPSLLVVDDMISILEMQDAVKEATEVWGAGPEAVVIDYVDLIPSADGVDNGSRVRVTLNALKAWSKQASYPLIVVHQGTRSNARPGAPITLLSLGFSGEAQGTIVLGVRRKRDCEDLDEYERRCHENSVTVHIAKNKRPGGRCTHWDGVDFHLAPETGFITPLTAAGAVARAQQAARNG